MNGIDQSRGLTRKTRGQAWIALLLTFGSLAPAVCFAQNRQDANFRPFLNNICNDPNLLFTSLDMYNTCQQLFPSGGAGGAAGAALSIGANLGVGAGQNRGLSPEARERARGGKDKKEASGDSGGGASADIQLGPVGITIARQTGRTTRVDTDLERGFAAKQRGWMFGLDYQMSNALIIGALVGSQRSASTFSSSSGTLNSDTHSGTFYLTWLPTERWYLGGYAGTASSDLDGTREISVGSITGTSGSRSSSAQRRLGIASSYDFYFGNWTVRPALNLDYLRTQTDAFSETGTTGLELRFPDQTTKSLTATLGVSVSHRLSFGWGAITPELRFGRVHEYDDDARQIGLEVVTLPGFTFQFQTDAPDRDYSHAGLALNVEAGPRVTMFADYDRRFGNSLTNNWVLNFGAVLRF